MLKEKELTNWVIKLSGNKISASDSEYFIKNIGVSMVALKEEMTKLLNYTGDKK